MTGGGGGEDRSTADRSDDAEPLSELAEIVAERRERPSGDGFDARFTEQSFDTAPEDTLWQDVVDHDGSEFGAIGEVIEEAEETYVVAKRNFCERCPHFSSPPAVHCTHDGTELLQFVDKDHVRVRSCPIVSERGFAADGQPSDTSTSVKPTE